MVKDVWKSENFKDNKVVTSARSEKKFYDSRNLKKWKA